MSAAVQKVCCVCRQDVSQRPRTKDRAGHYYCDECYGAKMSGSNGSSGTPPQPGSTSHNCTSCGQALAVDAAFCPRCGQKQPDGVSISEQIDLTEAVHWVSMYAEAAGTIATLHHLADGLETLATRGQSVNPVEAKRTLEVAEREARSADRVFEKARVHLRQFNRERLIGIRDQMLGHSSVPDTAKAGLRLDPLGIFGAPGIADAAVQVEATELPPSLSGSYGKLGGGKRNGGAKHYAPSSSPTPVGFGIAMLLMMIGAVCLLVCVLEVVTEGRITSLSVWLGGSSLLLLLLGWTCLANACPNCRLLFTGRIIDSASLGSHVEMRKEERVARHYNPSGGGIQGETRYEVDVPVHVQSFLHTRRCSNCGHVWQTTERREN